MTLKSSNLKSLFLYKTSCCFSSNFLDLSSDKTEILISSFQNLFNSLPLKFLRQFQFAQNFATYILFMIIIKHQNLFQ